MLMSRATIHIWVYSITKTSINTTPYGIMSVSLNGYLQSIDALNTPVLGILCEREVPLLQIPCSDYRKRHLGAFDF